MTQAVSEVLRLTLWVILVLKMLCTHGPSSMKCSVVIPKLI